MLYVSIQIFFLNHFSVFFSQITIKQKASEPYTANKSRTKQQRKKQ